MLLVLVRRQHDNKTTRHNWPPEILPALFAFGASGYRYTSTLTLGHRQRRPNSDDQIEFLGLPDRGMSRMSFGPLASGAICSLLGAVACRMVKFTESERAACLGLQLEASSSLGTCTNGTYAPKWSLFATNKSY